MHPPKLTLDDLPRPILPEPNADYKSSAPPVVVEGWCGLVAHMDREHLDRFTRSTWRRFDERDLAPLKAAILRRRAELESQRPGSADAAPRAATETSAASE
jgi:hypothetical protein